MKSVLKHAGILYVVTTPIGNMGDITLRAITILKEVDIIASEDTRHSGKLLKHLAIDGLLTSYHDFNKEEKTGVLLDSLGGGKNVALITDAGTPTISDPGYYLVRRAIQAGIRVVPVPGVSAIITALSISGLPTDSFSFHGFLPRKKGRRHALLETLGELPSTIVLYESPQRVNRTLNEILNIIGDRPAAVARELTKLYEEVIRGTLSEIISKIGERKIKGEITIIIAGKSFAIPDKPQKIP